MAKPRKKKRGLFILEILLLLLFIGGLYVYGQISKRLDIIDKPTQQANPFEEEVIDINKEAPKMTGYTTYALFGIDTRSQNEALGGKNSDTIIIASINNDTKDVKLVSLYRDTLLNIGDDIYAKANAAYAYGGPAQAISMLNKSLDLNIQDYATVDFSALVTVIDLLGGLDIPMSYAEIEHMNNYCVETSKETGKTYTPIPLPEPRPEDIEQIVDTYHLNGVQATSYCRIRYTANLDMGRTQRQRMVIQMISQKAVKAGLSTIFNIMDEVFPMVETSLNKTQILQMLPTLFGYSIDDTIGFPMKYKFSNVRGSVIVATSLQDNVRELHKFLYGEDVVYTPSTEVVEISNKILEIVGGEGELEDAGIQSSDTDTTEEDTFIWQDATDSFWTEDDYSQNEDYGDYDSESSGSTGGYGDSDYESGGSTGGYGDNGYGSSGSTGGYGDSDYGSSGSTGGYGDNGYGSSGSTGGYGDNGYGSGGSTGGYGDFSDGNSGGYDSGTSGGYDSGTSGGYDSGYGSSGSTGGYDSGITETYGTESNNVYESAYEVETISTEVTADTETY